MVCGRFTFFSSIISHGILIKCASELGVLIKIYINGQLYPFNKITFNSARDNCLTICSWYLIWQRTSMSVPVHHAFTEHA